LGIAGNGQPVQLVLENHENKKSTTNPSEKKPGNNQASAPEKVG